MTEAQRAVCFWEIHMCLSTMKEHEKVSLAYFFFQCLKIKSPYIVPVLSFRAVKNNFPYTQKLMSTLGLDILAD